MGIDRRTLIKGAAAASVLAGGRSRAQGVPVIKIGILNDQSGPYRDIVGPTGVACARQAVQEFTANHAGFTVEMVVGDHQNKAGRGQCHRRALV